MRMKTKKKSNNKEAITQHSTRNILDLSSKKTIGHSKESEAWQFLKQHGFTLLIRNYYCRLGEIDLIIENQACVVFVEVRYRKNKLYGGAAVSITPSKQRKLINAAELYIQTNPQILKKNCRFDVIAINGSEIEWIQNAIER